MEASRLASSLQLLQPSKLISFIVALWILDIIYKCTFHQLASVPGPFLAKFSQSWRNIRYFRGVWHNEIVALHKKYGSVVRIAPNELSIVDTAALKQLYGHGTKATKTNWYDTWRQPNMTDSSFSVTDVRVHRHLRARVASAYTMTSILTMEPLIQEVADDCWRKFGEFADSNQSLPLHEWVNYFAFDVVTELAMGGRLGFLNQGRDVDNLIRSIHDGFFLMSNMGNMPLQMLWFNNSIAQWVVKRIGGRRLNAFTLFLEWLEKRVEVRMSTGLGEKRRDMLQSFIEAKDVDGNPVEKGDVMIEGVNILAAGADTITVGILAIIGALIQHPEHHELVKKEVDEAYETLGLTPKEGITYKDTLRLPLLSAVIQESTRLHPSMQYQLPRRVPEGGVQIGPFHAEEGTICSINAASMNRSKEIFGHDADEWKPERWIADNEDDANRIKEQARLLTTFGMGSRSCIGKHLAMVEMYKFVAQFVRHFEFDVVHTEEPWSTRSQWFAFQADFWVKLERRRH